jgi:hypothetical protein
MKTFYKSQNWNIIENVKKNIFLSKNEFALKNTEKQSRAGLTIRQTRKSA